MYAAFLLTPYIFLFSLPQPVPQVGQPFPLVAERQRALRGMGEALQLLRQRGEGGGLAVVFDMAVVDKSFQSTLPARGETT